jgi:hypothetical protein
MHDQVKPDLNNIGSMLAGFLLIQHNSYKRGNQAFHPCIPATESEDN